MLTGMCRWMGSHFHDWIDHNGVAFSIELPNGVAHFRDFGVRIFWRVGSWVLKKYRTICGRKMRVKYVFYIHLNKCAGTHKKVDAEFTKHKMTMLGS